MMVRLHIASLSTFHYVIEGMNVEHVTRLMLVESFGHRRVGVLPGAGWLAVYFFEATTAPFEAPSLELAAEAYADLTRYRLSASEWTATPCDAADKPRKQGNHEHQV